MASAGTYYRRPAGHQPRDEQQSPPSPFMWDRRSRAPPSAAAPTGPRVVVVGGGLSGLTCARELCLRGCRVVVVEAADRVGGRTLSDEDGTDLGAAYVGPSQRHILRVADRYRKSVVPTPTDGKTVQFIRHVATHYSGTIPPVNVLAQLELNRALVECERLSDAIPADEPDKHPDAVALDGVTVEAWCRKICPLSADARAILATAVRAVLAVEPTEVSALAFLWYIKSNGGPKRIFETREGLQDSKIVGGAGRIALDIANEIESRGGVILLNTPVRVVDSTSPHEIVILTDNRELTCDYISICAPPVQRARMTFYPPLRTDKREALHRWKPGHTIKTFLYYRERYWQSRNLNGTLISDEGISMLTFDDTKADGSMPALMGFVMGKEATGAYRVTPRERCDRLAQHYAHVFKDERLLHPIRYKEKVWVDVPFVGGCYVGVPSMRTLTLFPRRLLCESEDPRVVYGSTECATRSVGYMDGAVEAGERAAVAILRAVGGGLLSRDDEYSLLNPPPSRMLVERHFRLRWWEKLLPSAVQLLVAIAVVLGLVLLWWIR